MIKSKFTPVAYTGSCEKALAEISDATVQQTAVECGVWLKYGTIAYTAVSSATEQLAAYLREHPEEQLPIDNLIRFMTVKSESETGEKAGNIVPVAELLDGFKNPPITDRSLWSDVQNVINSDKEPIAYPEGYERPLEEVFNRALQQLNVEYSLNMKYAAIIYSATVIFYRQCAEYLKAHPDEEITLSSLIKFRMVEGTNENGDKILVPVAELGERFKLGVKNDNATEEDEEFDA